MTHTPTPWRIEPEPDDEYIIRGANDEWIANNTPYYPSAPSGDDAAFIVKAVNSHDKLVEALRDVLARMDRSEEWWIDCPDRGGFDRDAIEAALEEL